MSKQIESEMKIYCLKVWSLFCGRTKLKQIEDLGAKNKDVKLKKNPRST